MPRSYVKRRIRTRSHTTTKQGKNEYQRKYMAMRRNQKKRPRKKKVKQ